MSENLKELFKYFKLNRRIVDIKTTIQTMPKFIPEKFLQKLPIMKRLGKPASRKCIEND